MLIHTYTLHTPFNDHFSSKMVAPMDMLTGRWGSHKVLQPVPHPLISTTMAKSFWCNDNSIHTKVRCKYAKCNYTVFQKNGNPFCFCNYSVCCSPILKIFGRIVAKKICNKTHISKFILMHGM